MAATLAGRLASKLTRATGSDNAASVYRRRRGDHEHAGRGLRRGRHPACNRPVSDQDLARGGDIVEQSSQNIWDASARSVRAAMAEAGIAPDSVGGIGFDATCSLVVLDPQGEPVTVSGSGDKQRNVIVWMDHRATAEARLINETEGCGAAPCRRLDLARDGDAEAVVAEAAHASEFRCCRPLLRPGRLPDLARDRIAATLNLHRHLQMELSRP